MRYFYKVNVIFSTSYSAIRQPFLTGNQSVISLSSNPPDSFDKNSNVDSLYFEHLLQWICFITLIHAHTGLIARLVSGEGCYGSKQVWLTPCGTIIQEKLKTATKRHGVQTAVNYVFWIVRVFWAAGTSNALKALHIFFNHMSLNTV